MSDTTQQVIALAVQTRIVDRLAVEDPELYDNSLTLDRLREFAALVAELVVAMDRTENALLRSLMREAVIAFHGKRCVFSAEFLEQAERVSNQSEENK